MQKQLPCRNTSVRFQPSSYIEASTSPLYIGELSVFLKYKSIYLAVVHRRDFSFPYIQTHPPCHWTSARFRSSLYRDATTSPLYIDDIGEISVLLIYRRIYLAVVHRRHWRDISLSYIQTHLPRRCISARRWFYIR